MSASEKQTFVTRNTEMINFDFFHTPLSPPTLKLTLRYADRLSTAQLTATNLTKSD